VNREARRIEGQIRYYELTLRNRRWGYWSLDERKGQGQRQSNRHAGGVRPEGKKESDLEGKSKSYSTCLNITSTRRVNCQCMVPTYQHPRSAKRWVVQTGTNVKYGLSDGH